MANYNNLLSTINGAIKTNGTGAITGQLLQTVLDGMVASLGAKYQYAGVATPATNPGTPDENVFYFAAQAGTYTNFGGLVVNDGEVCALKWDGTWVKDVTGAATVEQVNQLGQKLPQDGLMFCKKTTGSVDNSYTSPFGTNVKTYRLRIEVDNYTISKRDSGGSTAQAIVNFRLSDDSYKTVSIVEGATTGKQVLSLEFNTPIEIKSYGVQLANAVFSADILFALNYVADIIELDGRVNECDVQVEEQGNKINDIIAESFDIQDTRSLAISGSNATFGGTVINNNPAQYSGKVKNISVYTDAANTSIVVMILTKTGDSGFLVTAKQAISLPINGLNTIDTDLEVARGQYIGVWCSSASDMPPFKSGSATNGWYWYNVQSIEPSLNTTISAAYASGLTLCYGYYILATKEIITNTIVATRNEGDYNSIREIIEGITDVSYYNRYEIIVPSGRWFECDIQGKKYVSLVGQDREKSIIYCDGTQSNLTPANYSFAAYQNTPLSSVPQDYKHCIFAMSDMVVKNLTIEAKSCKYAAHLDTRTFQDISFDNCHFIGQNCYYPIGIGISAGQTISIKGSIIESISGGLGFVAHNWNNQNSGTLLSFEDCFFKNCGFATISELGSEQSDDWRILNCYSDRGGCVEMKVNASAENKTSWVNPDTGEQETDPTLVPYSIKLNCCGSNVTIIEKPYFGTTTIVARPNAEKYINAGTIICIPAIQEDIIGRVINCYMTGRTFGRSSSYKQYIIANIIDGNVYAYRTPCSCMLPASNVVGGTSLTPANIGLGIYATSDGMLTTATTDKKVGNLISVNNGLLTITFI